MPPAIQQPLLPLRRDGGPTSPLPGLPARRPGSQHTSPAKDILTAVEQGNAAGALRAATAACLRSPVLLLAAVAALLCAAGLTAWLLPQQPLPAMLAHMSQRERSEWLGMASGWPWHARGGHSLRWRDVQLSKGLFAVHCPPCSQFARGQPGMRRSACFLCGQPSSWLLLPLALCRTAWLPCLLVAGASTDGQH